MRVVQADGWEDKNAPAPETGYREQQQE